MCGIVFLKKGYEKSQSIHRGRPGAEINREREKEKRKRGSWMIWVLLENSAWQLKDVSVCARDIEMRKSPIPSARHETTRQTVWYRDDTTEACRVHVTT